jgi:hypothetical protein
MSETTAPRELYGWHGIVRIWFPLVAPVAAWTVHILYISSIARFTCTRPTSTWTIHAVTAGCLAVAAVATALSWRLSRQEGTEDADTTGGRHLFLGRLGLLVGAVNILVIALEELYAIGFHPVRCA